MRDIGNRWCFFQSHGYNRLRAAYDSTGDGNVDETEFVAHWTTLNLGDLQHAITLFHRADTDKDGNISRVPDFARLFYYFDRDCECNFVFISVTLYRSTGLNCKHLQTTKLINQKN